MTNEVCEKVAQILGVTLKTVIRKYKKYYSVGKAEQTRRNEAIRSSNTYKEAAEKLGLQTRTISEYGQVYGVYPQWKQGKSGSIGGVKMEEALTPEQCKVMRQRLSMIFKLMEKGYSSTVALKLVRSKNGSRRSA